MKKIILISAVTLFSTGAYATGCDESSLKGKYGYEVSGVNEFPLPPTFTTKVTRSTHVVGQAKFDGKGNFDISGYGSAAGSTAARTGSGTYTVNPVDCTAEGTLTWNTGETSNFVIVLDQTDNSKSDSANRAYHSSVLVASDGVITGLPVKYPSSASGSLTRFNGKFN
ncbi:MAG: hypothetical protein PHF31_08240 [Methylobacter sp.]|nr:hypothetical protein [Methylobacter sp.]